MLGKFQTSELRIEVKATELVIRDGLLNCSQLKQWFSPLQLKGDFSSELTSGDVFISSAGLLEVENKVEIINSNCFNLLLSKGIDGYQQWCWGDGWVQSRLEGVSVLPLSLGHSFNLLRLRNWLNNHESLKTTTKIIEIE